ncbi:MAG: sulfatase [Candidatus Lokiarchaeota archaeon]|nr:sulfatase [Candidatus Lokiarchaeota archaeon]
MSHTTRPNVIWIFGDQHPWHALGCNGNPDVKTPNIDAIAAAGVNFVNAVAGYPLCCPFRGSLLTGRYPHKVVPGHQYQMDPAERTVAHAFNEAGYKTAYFGKWHVDGFQEEHGDVARHVVPPERRGGFQRWVGYENNNKQWDTWVHGGEGGDAFQYKLPDFETDCLAALLVDYIKGVRAEGGPGDLAPFFAVLSVQPPHNPYFAPEEFMERYFDLDTFTPKPLHLRENVPPIEAFREAITRDLAGAYAMIENLDWNVGRVLDALVASGLARDTIVVFFSDHGDMHGSHGHQRKTSPYNESVRVPMIVGYAADSIASRKAAGAGATDQAGRRSDAMLNHVDLAPTTLGLCHVPIPKAMEGTDYSGHVLRGQRAPGEPESAYLQSVIPTGHGDCVDKPWRGVLTRDGWKYVCFEGVEWLMFNLNDDPFELQNLAHYTRYLREKKRLNAVLEHWIERAGDTFTLPDLGARERRIQEVAR